MNTAFLAIGIVGGAVTILVVVFGVTRNILKQVNATDNNSKVLAQLQESVATLTREMHDLRGEVAQLNYRLGTQTDRISLLERTVRGNGTGH